MKSLINKLIAFVQREWFLLTMLLVISFILLVYNQTL